MGESELLAAITAFPADTMRRLIYADWLEDRNDPRAEFIRLHHQLAIILDRLQHIRPDLDSAWIEAVEVRRDVVLHSFDPEHRREIIKYIRLRSGYGLEQVRDQLRRLPTILFANQSLEHAERLRQDLALIANVTIESPSSRSTV